MCGSWIEELDCWSNWIAGVTLGELFLEKKKKEREKRKRKKKRTKLCRALYACESLVVLAVKRLVIFN